MPPRDRVARARALHGVLAGVLLLASFASLQVGATDVILSAMLAKWVQDAQLNQVERVVLFDTRLHRLALGARR